MKMKITLLICTALTSFGLFGQFTQTNSPVTGESIKLYVVDSLANTYDAETGNNATWDYSSLFGYDHFAKMVTVQEVAGTAYDTTFTSSSHFIEIEGYLQTYFTDPTMAEKISQGFVYINSDTSLSELGNIVVPFTDKTSKYFNYPFNLGDAVTDTYKGTGDVKVDFGGGSMLVIKPELEGDVTVTYDGIGTLKLAGNSYSNVSRLKTDEFAWAEVVDLGDTARLYRTQYEYYDFTISNLPIFIRSHLIFSLGGMNLIDVNIALSYEDPLTAGLEVNKVSSFTVYPNPANEQINIHLNTWTNNSDIFIIDALGRTVYTSTLSSNNETINVANLNKGIYTIQVNQEGIMTTQKIVIE
ncbi:MAG: T9SS type A sorting domain-containing protein [Brumimicrobium sp.]|nr:T9SS type A sorting domain-containing protein [Brumimicrobium sp.]